MANLDRIKSLIEKLQRLSKSSNVHEAELAASRMADILLKYNLSLSDIELEEEKLEKGSMNLGGSSCESLWRADLHSGISNYNFCRSIRINGTQRVACLGKKHNLLGVQYMYDYLSKTIWRLAKEAANQDGLELAGRYSYLNSFATHAVWAIVARLKAERETKVKVESDSRALVVQEDALVQKEFDADMGKDTIKTKRSGVMDAVAAIRGREAGKRVGIHKGVESAGPRKGVR